MTGAKIIRPVILDKKEKLGTLSSAQQMYGLLLKNQSLVSGKYIITLSSRMVKLDLQSLDTMLQVAKSSATKIENVWLLTLIKQQIVA